MRRTSALVAVSAVVATALTGPASLASPDHSAARSALDRSAELSTTARLPDRRSLVVGDRMYEVGTEDGSYPAMGFHTRGEMGASGRRR